MWPEREPLFSTLVSNAIKLPAIITKNNIKRKCKIRNSVKEVNLNCDDKLRRRGREKTKNTCIFHA